MPNMLVHLPEGSYPGDARGALVRRLNDAAARAEQIPAEARRRMLCWISIDEVAPGAWTCGGADLTAELLPCVVQVHLPAGVLDESSRAAYVRALHEAFELSLPQEDKRQLATSVLLQEVPDGRWGVNGAIWRLPQFAKAAGFVHLQHLA